VRRNRLNSNTAQENFDTVVDSETEDLMGISFECVCGETHKVPIRYLSVEKGAVGEFSAKLDELGFRGRGVAVCDRKIAGSVVTEALTSLEGSGRDLSLHPVGDGIKLIPAEIPIGEKLASDVKGRADYLVAVGSGVISDLVKYAANKLGIPCVLVATAPSMNGYTSSMAALTEDGIKKTVAVEPAHAVFADIDILKKAPVELIRSGLGDIVSKSICNADWKLSQLVKKTYFCPLPFRITDKTEPRYLESSEEIGKRSEEGIRILTEGIMRSGLSMTIIGTSTPSSGAEHFISHYWDLVALKEEKPKLLHGTQVGVATLSVLDLYRWTKDFRVNELSLDRLKKHYSDRKDEEEFIVAKFGRYAKGVAQQYLQKHISWDNKKQELESIIESWDSLWNELEPYIREKEPVERALRQAGAPTSYTEIGKTRDDAIDTILHAKYIRGRYTILDLLSDLGILEQAAEAVLD
jgi:glycerol-1-phosphate dehydrogenase [NAD(P)+]